MCSICGRAERTCPGGSCPSGILADPYFGLPTTPGWVRKTVQNLIAEHRTMRGWLMEARNAEESADRAMSDAEQRIQDLTTARDAALASAATSHSKATALAEQNRTLAAKVVEASGEAIELRGRINALLEVVKLLGGTAGKASSGVPPRYAVSYPESAPVPEPDHTIIDPREEIEATTPESTGHRPGCRWARLLTPDSCPVCSS